MRLPQEYLECVVSDWGVSSGQLSVCQPERLDFPDFFTHLAHREAFLRIPIEDASDEGVGFGGDWIGVAEVVWVVAEVEVVEIGGGEGVLPRGGAGD